MLCLLELFHLLVQRDCGVGMSPIDANIGLLVQRDGPHRTRLRGPLPDSGGSISGVIDSAMP